MQQQSRRENYQVNTRINNPLDKELLYLSLIYIFVVAHQLLINYVYFLKVAAFLLIFHSAHVLEILHLLLIIEGFKH